MFFLNDFANIFLGVGSGGGMDASEKRERGGGLSEITDPLRGHV